VTVTVEVLLNGVRVPVELDDQALAAIAAAIPNGGPAEPVSPYLNVKQAAAYLCTSRQRIYDLISARQLERIKEGQRVLIERAELDAYLARNRNRRRTR
jgi:excisionase family DNA binding protein